MLFTSFQDEAAALIMRHISNHRTYSSVPALARNPGRTVLVNPQTEY